jgi:hypothetical protein
VDATTEWGGSTYNGGYGYFSGGGAGKEGSGQAGGEGSGGGDAYGGYYYDEEASLEVTGDGVYSANGYDYGSLRQTHDDGSDSQVTLTYSNFENVNYDSSSGASQQEEKNEKDAGSSDAGGENQKEYEGGVGNSEEGEYGANYQSTYDPFSDFDIKQCDTYQNLWLWDLSLTCESEDSLDSCRCVFAEELRSVGLLKCADAVMCPSSCPICSTCLQLLGCADATSFAENAEAVASVTAPTFISSYAYTLGAAAGLLVFGASYFVVVKRRSGGASGDLSAHLMTDQPVSGLTVGGFTDDGRGSTSDSHRKDRMWLAPAKVRTVEQGANHGKAVSHLPKDQKANPDPKDSDSDDQASTTSFTLDQVGMTDDEALYPKEQDAEQDELSVGKSTIATLDEVFEAGDQDDEFEKVWLAPMK